LGRRSIPLLILLAFCLQLSAIAVTPTAPPPQPDTFPVLEIIKPNVEFWKRVWGEWRLSQIAIHDRHFPGVVYEVVDLPGPIDTRLSSDQRQFIDKLTKRWMDRVEQLEHKVRHGDPLSDDEKRWALALTEHAGSEGVDGAHKRVRTQRGLKERFLRGVEISGRYEAQIRTIFREAGLPEDLALLPHVESSFQYGARSSAGAVGAWQFTRGTGRKFMPITSAFDSRLDTLAAAKAAASYLKGAYARLGSWPLALTSYNHGVAGMQRARDAHGSYEQVFLNYKGRSFGFASKNFYSEFVAARELATEAQQRFPGEYTLEAPFDHEAIRLESRTTPSRLAKAFDLPLDELVSINPAFTRRAVREGLALPEGVMVWLPRGTQTRLAANGHEPDYTLSGWIDGDGTYVVQNRDTLSLIAETYGVSIAQLRSWNGLPRGSSLIKVGQHLRLAGEAGSTHVVRRGESLSSIAQSYRMPVNSLRQLNGFAPNENLIRVGQKMRVSGEYRPNSARVHVVRSGDTLGRIAGNYRVQLRDLLRLNGLSSRAVIHPGQRLRIPS
jgi:membrane-bound lytic murein transglycosylase D